MRRLLKVWVVAATVLLPAIASAGNQEVAQQIATNIRDSGQLNDYKIAVKYQDGTVWLEGRVRDQEQLNKAVKVVFQTSSVMRVVVNNVATGPAPAGSSSQAAAANATAGDKLGAKMAVLNPLRKSQSGASGDVGQAQKLPATFAPSSAQRATASEDGAGNVKFAMMQPPPAVAPVEAVPAPPPPPRAVPNRRAEPGPLPIDASSPPAAGQAGPPMPMYAPGVGGNPAPTRVDQPAMPGYAWPSYAAYPNYAAVTYPRQYSPTAWPYIGPFYPYPQVPLGWRKVSLEWSDGWWFLDFKDKPRCCWWR